MITFLIKFLIALVGLILTLIYFVIGLIKKNKGNFGIAGTVFMTTAGLIVFITAAEFLFHDKEKDYADKETALVAMREASLGGIHLRVYVDSTYDLGNGSKVTIKGRIKINHDTLFLLSADSIAKSFLVDSKVLREIKNTGINFLEIESNKLMTVD